MFAILLLKLLIFFLRSFTKYSATALPGLWLEKYFPGTLRILFRQFDHVILVTGTNGKTTTTRLLCHLLNKNNISYISNSSGSNLIRGIAAVLIQKVSITGKIPAKLGVFEVEEATMPKLTKFVTPQTIIITNIFRDQLDAYGEIDKTLQYILEAVKQSNNPKLILNYDDQRVASAAQYSTNSVELISLDPQYHELIKFEKKNITTPQDPRMRVSRITNIHIDDNLHTTFDIKIKESTISKIITRIPGVHNSFNTVAALYGFASITNTRLEDIFDKYNCDVSTFEPVFGRGELTIVNKTTLQTFLVKNPAGMNLNLHLLENTSDREAIFLVLNDKIADGRDVSWIWDCDFTILKNLGFKNIFVAGSRRWDMTLRVVYDDMEVTKTFETIDEALDFFSTSELKKIFVLPTYTAMLELRQKLRKYTDIKEMWQE